ncbi:MAG TPA: hypothetical protein DIW64_09890 [Cellvibrio sp.]|nr:hypothetical protein [Cellvibrio sp.]
MAPAIYTLVFGYFDGGFISIRPVLKLMLGFWIGALILSLIYQLLTRSKVEVSTEQDYRKVQPGKGYVLPETQDDFDSSSNNRRTASTRGLSREERIARDELLLEEPIRAVR